LAHSTCRIPKKIFRNKIRIQKMFVGGEDHKRTVNIWTSKNYTQSATPPALFSAEAYTHMSRNVGTWNTRWHSNIAENRRLWKP